MDRSLLAQDWFEALVTDCKAIVVEGEFVSRWALIETYHEVGGRILKDNDNFKRSSIYGQQIARTIGEVLGKSERTIQYAIAFAKKYPVLDEAPLEKNASWTKVVNELLPENPREEIVRRCKCCGFDQAKTPTEHDKQYHRHPDIV
jgi:hypothetical protein